MAWSNSLNNKFAKIQPKEEKQEKKENSSFYEDHQARKADSAKSYVTALSAKSTSSAKKSGGSSGSSSKKSDSGSGGSSKKAAPTTVLGNNTKFFSGYQTYQDRKKSGNVFTPSTVLGKHTNMFDTDKARKEYIENQRIAKGAYHPNTQLTSGSKATEKEMPSKLKMYGNDIVTGLNNAWLQVLQSAKVARGNSNTYKLSGLGDTSDIEIKEPIDAIIDGLLDLYTKHTESGQQRSSEMHYQTPGKTDDYVGQAVQTVANAIPNTVVAAMTGGTSEAPELTSVAANTASKVIANTAKNPNFWWSLAQTVGPEYEKAKQDGASETQARAAAWSVGLANSLIEIGGGIETFNPTETSFGKNLIKSAIEEGSEEVYQGGVENLVEKSIYDKDRPIYSTTDEDAVINPKRAAQEFGGGALVAGVMGGARQIGHYGAQAAGKAYNAYNNTVQTGREFKNMGGDVVQSVIDSGIDSDASTSAYKYAQKLQDKQSKGADLSDWNVGRQYQKNVKAIDAEESLKQSVESNTGVPIETQEKIFTRAGQEANGRYVPSGAAGERTRFIPRGGIDISENSDISNPQTLGHEITHAMKANAPTAYKALEDYVMQAAAETNAYAINDRMTELKEKLGYTDEVAREEMVADTVREFFGNKSSIDNIVNSNPSLADKIKDGIKSVKASLQDKTKSPYRNKADIETTYKQLAEIEKRFNAGLREMAENYKAGNVPDGDGGVKYSPIEYDEGGRAYVRIENDVLDGVPRNQWAKTVSKWLNQNIQGNEYTAQSDGDRIKTTRRFTNEYGGGVNSQTISDTPEYDAKMNLAGNIDEAITISRKTGSASDDVKADSSLKHGNFAKNGWDYRTFNFEYNGKRYVASLNVAKGDRGHKAYDVTNIKETEPLTGSRHNSEDTRITAQSLNKSISDEGGNVKFSLKEGVDNSAY